MLVKVGPGRRQAIIWTDAAILLIGPLATNFSEILIEILTFSFKKMRLKVSSAKWQPSCLDLNVLSNLIVACWRHTASYNLITIASGNDFLHHYEPMFMKTNH